LKRAGLLPILRYTAIVAVCARLLHLFIGYLAGDASRLSRLVEEREFVVTDVASPVSLHVRNVDSSPDAGAGASGMVRLLGIDMPKRGPDLEAPLKAAAVRRLTQLTVRKPIHVRLDRRQVSKDGELLAYVYVGSQFINRILVAEGLAVLDALPCDCAEVVRELSKAEHEAQAAGAGCWGNMTGEFRGLAFGNEY
jgi:endonuclease YncB( thermonuclease family)